MLARPGGVLFMVRCTRGGGEGGLIFAAFQQRLMEQAHMQPASSPLHHSLTSVSPPHLQQLPLRLPRRPSSSPPFSVPFSVLV